MALTQLKQQFCVEVWCQLSLWRYDTPTLSFGESSPSNRENTLGLQSATPDFLLGSSQSPLQVPLHLAKL